MRTTAFGDVIVESTKDDMGLVEALQEAGDNIHAVVRLDEEGSGKFYFDILRSETAEDIVSSDPIFDSHQDACDYLRGYVSHIQRG